MGDHGARSLCVFTVKTETLIAAGTHCGVENDSDRGFANQGEGPWVLNSV